MTARAKSNLVARLERALLTVAEVCDLDPAALPIFERLEWELENARADEADDPIERARARLRAARQTDLSNWL